MKSQLGYLDVVGKQSLKQKANLFLFCLSKCQDEFVLLVVSEKIEQIRSVYDEHFRKYARTFRVGTLMLKLL